MLSPERLQEISDKVAAWDQELRGIDESWRPIRERLKELIEGYKEEEDDVSLDVDLLGDCHLLDFEENRLVSIEELKEWYRQTENKGGRNHAS